MSSMNNNLYEPYISRYMSVDINGNWAPRTINKEQTILYIFVSAAAAQTLDIEKFAQHKSEAFVCCFPFLLLSVSRRMRKNPSVMRRAPCVTPHTQRPKSSIQFGMRSSLNFLSVLFGSTLAAPMSRKENGTKCERRRRKRNTLPCYSKSFVGREFWALQLQ